MDGLVPHGQTTPDNIPHVVERFGASYATFSKPIICTPRNSNRITGGPLLSVVHALGVVNIQALVNNELRRVFPS